MTTLKIVAALGCGLIAGIFFAFSVFIMNALGRLQPTQGMPAMQQINITVLNPLFLLVFMGTAFLSLGLGGFSVARWAEPGSRWVLAGALLYVLGTFAVTVVGNVPLNDRLAAARPDHAEGVAIWSHYLVAWTRWNHVRTLAAILAMLCYLLSLAPRAS